MIVGVAVQGTYQAVLAGGARTRRRRERPDGQRALASSEQALPRVQLTRRAIARIRPDGAVRLDSRNAKDFTPVLSRLCPVACERSDVAMLQVIPGLARPN